MYLFLTYSSYFWKVLIVLIECIVIMELPLYKPSAGLIIFTTGVFGGNLAFLCDIYSVLLF